jgi:4-amino-4-deoxy-L-arabinose transferase-like glycosyltransferase
MATKPSTIRWLILMVVATGLLCRLAYVFFTPVFRAPDEQAHFNYLQHLAEKRTFPVMTKGIDDPANEWEYHQPPVYYLLLAPVFGAAKAAGASLETTVRLLRLPSVLFWLLNVWLGVTLLKRLEIKDDFTRVFVLAMACLLPTYTFISSVINNDNLLITLGGALLCLMARQPSSLKQAVGLGLLLGLALLTKKSAVVFLPAIALMWGLAALRGRMRWSSVAAQLAVVAGLAALLYAPWAWRDWQVYGTLNPELLATPRKEWPSIFYGSASAIHNLVKTFWAASGASNDVSYPFPVPGMLLLLLGCLPLTRWCKPDPTNSGMTGATMAVYWFIAGVTVLLSLRFGYLFGMGQGRHLFPVLFPVALLLAARLRPLPLPRLELCAALAWMIYAVSFMVFTLWRLR